MKLSSIKKGMVVTDTDMYTEESGLKWLGTIQSKTKTHVFVQEKIRGGFLVRYTNKQAEKYLKKHN